MTRDDRSGWDDRSSRDDRGDRAGGWRRDDAPGDSAPDTSGGWSDDRREDAPTPRRRGPLGGADFARRDAGSAPSGPDAADEAGPAAPTSGSGIGDAAAAHDRAEGDEPSAAAEGEAGDDRDRGPARRPAGRQYADRARSDRREPRGSWDRDRPRRDDDRRGPGRGRDDRRDDRRDARRDDRDDAERHVRAPVLDDAIAASDLDSEVRRDLRGLQKETAETVARHLVAAGSLVDDDPQLALEHARYARRRASRIAVVREASGIVAYHAGEWTEALGELRAARRMGGGPGHLALMADIERALGRPERALELTRGPEVADLAPADRIELLIVAAGARRDLGELDAAIVGLQVPDLDPARRDPWSARLFYAYADNLLAAGREADAVQWFVHAHDADVEGETDAAARIAELTGEELESTDDITFGEEEYPLDDLSAGEADVSTAVEDVVDPGSPDPGAPDPAASDPDASDPDALDPEPVVDQGGSDDETSTGSGPVPAEDAATTGDTDVNEAATGPDTDAERPDAR